MMGHRGTNSGGEVDALTRSKRHYYWKAGVRKWWKRKFNKRKRRLTAQPENTNSNPS